MSTVLVLVVEVVDGVAVCQDDCLVTPLLTQDIGKQTVAAAARNTLITVVCAHNLLYVTLLNQSLEGRQVGLPQVTH